MNWSAVVTQPDKPVGRDQRIQAPPIKAALAEKPVSRFFNRSGSKTKKPSRKSARSRRMSLS